MTTTPAARAGCPADNTTTLRLARLLKRPVADSRGASTGRLADVIVRLRGTDYPLVTGLVAAVGGREIFVPVDQVSYFDGDPLRLSSARLSLRHFDRREGEVLLQADVPGHLARLRVAYRAAGRARLRGPFARIRRLKPAQIAGLPENASKEEETEILGRVHAADPAASVIEVSDTDPVRVGADADITDVAVLKTDYNLITIPVVDDVRRLRGVITVDDVLEATLPADWRRREAAEPAGHPARGRPLTAFSTFTHESVRDGLPAEFFTQSTDLITSRRLVSRFETTKTRSV